VPKEAAQSFDAVTALVVCEIAERTKVLKIMCFVAESFLQLLKNCFYRLP
jgi:hypothetical protein